MKNLLSILLFLCMTSSLFSQSSSSVSDGDKWKVWGYAFGDYFYKVAGDSTGSGTEFSSYKKDFNTFEFRRIYLGLDHSISRKFSAHFILSYEGKDFTSASNRAVFVKDANLKWNNIFEGSDLIIGLMPTPGFSFISEKVWGYRSVEKTIADMRGAISSRDIGVMLKGNIDGGKNYGYALMIGNGRGTRLENNKYKKFYTSLNGYFAERKIVADTYFDFETLTPDQERMTYKGFLGYQTKKLSAGVEAFQQEHKFTGANLKSFGISSFVSGEILKDRLNFFVRFDHYDPSSNNSSTGYKENFFTAGLDIMPADDVHFIPNVWVNTYSRKNPLDPEIDADVVARMTFYYIYK